MQDAVAVLTDARELRFSVPPSDLDWFMGLDLPQSSSASLRQMTYLPADAEICGDCSLAAETCQSVGAGQLIHLVDRSGPSVVRIRPGADASSNATLSVGAYSTH